MMTSNNAAETMKLTVWNVDTEIMHRALEPAHSLYNIIMSLIDISVYNYNFIKNNTMIQFIYNSFMKLFNFWDIIYI